MATRVDFWVAKWRLGRFFCSPNEKKLGAFGDNLAPGFFELWIPELEYNGIKYRVIWLRKADHLASFISSHCSWWSDREVPSAPFPLRNNHATFDFSPVSEERVLCLRLPANKSTAAVFIKNRTLRERAPFVIASPTYLFNSSLSTCSFPAAWKEAIEIPFIQMSWVS